MKILVIMKRFGANKDMVMQNFGRQVRLFESLSELGHKIDFLCPDYKKFEIKNIKRKKLHQIVKPKLKKQQRKLPQRKHVPLRRLPDLPVCLCAARRQACRAQAGK